MDCVWYIDSVHRVANIYNCSYFQATSINGINIQIINPRGDGGRALSTAQYNSLAGTINIIVDIINDLPNNQTSKASFSVIDSWVEHYQEIKYQG